MIVALCQSDSGLVESQNAVFLQQGWLLHASMSSGLACSFCSLLASIGRVGSLNETEVV